MDAHAIEQPPVKRAGRLTLRIGSCRYPILAQTRDTCLIQAPGPAPLGGFADIYDGDDHRARCLVVLSAPEGDCIRVTYKYCTAVAAHPPSDFARD